jgi:hypothetical protein
MRIAATDLSQGRMVDPPSVLAYLRAGRWIKLDEHRNQGRHVATLFESRHHDVVVHVPVWSQARDYARCLAEAINVIAAAEGRSPIALLADLQAAPADTLRLRLGDAPLPLSRSIAALSSTRTLLELAARASGFSSNAADLLEQVTLGLGEPGDTSVRVLVPVSSIAAPSTEPIPLAAEDAPAPPGRRLTEALARLVTRAHQAAQAAVDTGTIEPFTTQSVNPGSCRALAAIGAPLQIELAWALTLPHPATPAMSFTPEQLAALAAAPLTPPA